MSSIITSKLTERSQTTLPPAVRTVLGLEPGERIGYLIEGTSVRLVNASALEHDDPVLSEFLSFLARDMAKRPDGIGAFPQSLLARAREVVRGVAIDHDEPLPGAVEL
jgi:antitoxin PrlF